MKTPILLISLIIYSPCLFSQNSETIAWLTFEQLEDSLQTKQKKVFIDFYADWCAPCLKMQQTTYKDPAVIKKLNSSFYAVKMNVETTDTIVFGGKLFINERINRRNPVHQIALLMGSRKNIPFSLPVMVLLDEQFIARARYFQYLNPEQFLQILKQY